MRTEFKRKPIRKLLSKIIDNRGKTVPASDEGIPLIATNCIQEHRLYPTFENIRYVSEEIHNTWFRAHLEPDDILFVNKGTPGRVCMVPDPVNFCAAQDMIGLRANRDKIYPRYLFAFLRSRWVKETIRNYHVGLAIPHFKKQDLNTITVPERSMTDQKWIGNLFFLLSEKIELNHRINEGLEGLAKLLYDYWFVQFDFPISAKQAAAMGDPKLKGKPYRQSGGKITYNPTLKREIPEGWGAGSLSDIAKITMGQSPPGESYNNTGEGTLFFQGSTDFGWRFPTARQYTTQPTRFAKEGDILLSVRAPVGTMNVAPYDCAIGRGLAALRSKTKHDTYLWSVMFYFKQIFDRRNTDGTTFGSINKDDLHSLQVAIPDPEIVENFEEKVRVGNSMIATNQNQSQELTALRDWLLPMLMNGQVTVKSTPDRAES
jgi:type I restriction enzyme S subunit